MRSKTKCMVFNRNDLIEHLQNELGEYESALMELKRKVITLEDQLRAKVSLFIKY